jgi:gamma-glutamylcyclotransferase (GGCT)/AIG2-like uncharacterized protein YtfP
VIPVFAYGTLRDERYQRALFGRAFARTPARVTGWRTIAGERGYLTVVRDPAATCSGELVALDRRALAIADAWEGGYRRVRVCAEDAGGALHGAWLYVRPTASLTAPPPGTLALRPHAEVLAGIRSL